MKQTNLFRLLEDIIREYRSNQQWGTAHVYQSTYNSFALYNKGRDFPFRLLTPARLKDYESYLRSQARSWNTVATYMKVLKSIYNRAVEKRMAPFVPNLFRGVRSTPVVERKRALEATTMSRVLQASVLKNNPLSNTGKTPAQEQQATRSLFSLMFLLRGIPFVDLAYLRKCDVQGEMLYYRRRKTGRPLAVQLTPEAQSLIRSLQTAEKSQTSPYLLPLLSREEGSEAAYREYQSALRRFNRQLKQLPELYGSTHVSSYCARHTWATTAYHCEIHTGIISEAMGHSSIAVTETYLKPFRDERIDQANRQVIDSLLGKRRRAAV